MAADLFLLLARILLAAMFLSSGYTALSDIEGTTQYFSGLGVPLPALATWFTGLFELVAGALLVIGFQIRIVATLLAAFSIAATFLGHYGQGGGDPMLAFMHGQMLMKDVAVAGGLIVLSLHWPGRISVDGRRSFPLP